MSFIKSLSTISIPVLVLCMHTNMYAQKDFLPVAINGHKDLNYVKTITDTLDDNFDSATVTLYASPNGGFVGGNSGYHESAKAQEFDVDTFSYAVEGFIYWFGYKAMESLPADSSALNLKFWNNNSSVVINSVNRLAPFSVYDSTYLYINNMNADTMFAAGANVWMIVPRTVSSNYSAGFTMEKLNNKDTISIMNSSDDDAPVEGLSWEKWNGAWNLITVAWSLNIDFAIFPLVNLGLASIEDQPFIEGLKYTLYPNPVTDWMNIDMDIENAGEYTIMLHDLNGRLMSTRNLGWLTEGRISTSLEVYDLASGNYILSVSNGKKGVSKRFIKN